MSEQTRQAARPRFDRGAGSPERASDRSAVAAEALGYLGAAIVVAGATLLAQQFWDEMSAFLRLGLVGSAAVALVGAGFALGDGTGGVRDRMRGVLWLGGTAATAGFLGLVGTELLDLHGLDLTVLTALGTLLLSCALWFARPGVLQQISTMVLAMLAAAALVADLVTTNGLPGVAVWAVGAIWLLLGWGSLLAPRSLVMPLGALSMQIGAMLTTSSDPGIVFALGTVVAVVSVSVAVRDLAVLGVGVVGSLQVLPMAMTEWFPDTAAAPIALIVGGLLLVVLAMWVARRGSHRSAGSPAPTGHHLISRTTAVAAAGIVLVSTLALVFAAALV